MIVLILGHSIDELATVSVCHSGYIFGNFVSGIGILDGLRCLVFEMKALRNAIGMKALKFGEAI
jgi:hypothetical protein